MKRLLIVLLTLVVILCCLVACKNTEQNADTSDTTEKILETTEESAESTTAATSESDTESSETSAETEDDTEPLPSIADLTLEDYYIVIPNKCPAEITNNAKKLSTGIRNTSGASVTYMSDVLIGETGPVILLGDTKYPESAETKALLTEEYSFAIKVFSGGRIAICANDAGVLQEAVEYFIENYVAENNTALLLSDSTIVCRQIDLEGVGDSILLSVNGATKYGIVYPENADGLEKKVIERFAGELEEKANADFSIYKDSSVKDASNEFEIIIGDTTRSDNDDMPASNRAWKVYSEGKKIFINGSTPSIMADALNSFVTDVVKVDGEFVYISDSIDLSETLAGYDRAGWEIAAPAYDGGKLSPIYNNGTGRYNGNLANESNMVVVSETSAPDFNAYLAKLEDNGYELITKTVIDGNIYAQYEKGYSLVYAYYEPCFAEARIIDDCASVSEDEFEYTYEVGEGETFEVVQYGIMSTHDGTWPSNGMFYIIKLADNSVILIDGGNSVQATNSVVDGVYEYMRQITGTPKDEKIRVAALFYTHPHGDHINMSPRLVSRHGDKIDIERLMVNFPNENVPVGDDRWSGTIVSFIGSLKDKYPDVKMVQLHRGQQIELGGAQFTVMYTQEDTVSAETGVPSFTALNNYTAVIMMEANGVKTLFLGDVGNKNDEKEVVMDILLTPYSDETLKCDVVQVSHHGYNRLERAYDKFQAKYALFSTFDVSDKKLLSYNQKIIYNALLTRGLTSDTIFFQGRKTWNLSMIAGKVTVTYDDIRGYDEGYMDHLGSCAAHQYTTVYGKTFETVG